MKHVIWVTPGFAADENDSQCIPPQQLLAREIGREGIKLHIVSLHYPYTNKSYEWYGATVYPSFIRGILGRFRIWMKAIQTVRFLMKTHPDAILHSFWLNDACLVACLANWRIGRPHLATLMGQDARSTNRYLRFLPLKQLYKVALSRFHQQQFEQTTGKVIQEVIPWGLPQQPTPVQNRPYHLIGIGNLIPLKCFHKWVNVVDDLCKDLPTLQAILIGDGPERESLEQIIKGHQLEAHIKLTGAVPREEVMSYLQRTRVLLHPSSYESYGFVLLEALQQGTQVVSTAVGIAPELPGVKLAKTQDEMVQAVKEALQDSAAGPKVPEAYHLSKVKAAYVKVYQDLSANNRR